MAARHLDLGFSKVNQATVGVQAFPGFVGEVLSVDPVSVATGEKPKTLANVTLRRVFLPEHTRRGRLPHHGRNELFNDADNGEATRFVVPVEELIILHRKVSRASTTNGEHKQAGTTALISQSYSIEKGVWLHSVDGAPSGVNGSNGAASGETSKSAKNSKTCHRCKTRPVGEGKTTASLCVECVQILRPFRKLQGTKQSDSCECEECMMKLRERICSNFSVAVERSHNNNSRQSDRESSSTNDICMVCCRACKTGVRCAQCNGAMHKHCHLWNKTLTVVDRKRKFCRTCAASDDELDDEDRTVVSTLQRLVPTDFDLPATLMARDTLPRPSARVITAIKPRPQKAKSASNVSGKKRGRQSKGQAKGSESGESAKKARMDTQQPPPLAEEFAVFEPTCSRTLPYNHSQGRVQGVKKHLVSAATDVYIVPDLRRNHRPAEKDDEDSANNQTKSSTGRAARANQRRVMKGVAALRQHHHGGSNMGTSGSTTCRTSTMSPAPSSTSFLELDAIAGRESNVLRFDRSGIHAWGVFADEPITAGEMIVEYRGEIIGNAMAEKRQVEYERARGSDYMFRIDAHTVCDATKLGNVARFLNASCDPNCYTQIITIQGTKRIAIYAKKDIRVGDELCYDYKFSLEYDEEKRIPCHCGAKDCRGYMNWDKKFDGRKAR